MKIPLDPPPWEGKSAVMASWEEGGFRRFALAGRTDIISAAILGSDLALFPERSSGHRALAAVLAPTMSGETP